ncbi:MAG: hypothetical protein L0271_04285 [Gemmatimonadetes bacterium]|nr:hypothetical protein [Gemmatimonadota bacterium]
MRRPIILISAAAAMTAAHRAAAQDAAGRRTVVRVEAAVGQALLTLNPRIR